MGQPGPASRVPPCPGRLCGRCPGGMDPDVARCHALAEDGAAVYSGRLLSRSLDSGAGPRVTKPHACPSQGWCHGLHRRVRRRSRGASCFSDDCLIGAESSGNRKVLVRNHVILKGGEGRDPAGTPQFLGTLVGSRHPFQNYVLY